MSTSIRSALALTGLAALALTAARPAAAQATFTYTLTVLDTLDALGGRNASGQGVNDSGQVAGYSNTAVFGIQHAFLSAPGGTPVKDLGTLDMGTVDGSVSYGMGVNTIGQVTGESNATTGYHAFLSGVNGGSLKDLGSLGGYYSYGQGVNDSGQVAGFSSTAADGPTTLVSPIHAFLSGVNGGSLKDLGTLGGTTSGGLGVNASGQVAGSSSTASGDTHAFLSGVNGGSLTDLGTLGGTTSFGRGVNASGQVVGYSTTTGGGTHAFLSGVNGGSLTDLGTLGGTSSVGQGVNASGQVVGNSTTTGDTAQHAFLYSGGVMTDLNTLITPNSGFLLDYANGISDTGFITGAGTNSAGFQYAFLLTPNAPAAVPEASTTVSFGLLLVLGLGGAVIAAKRKKVVAS